MNWFLFFSGLAVGIGLKALWDLKNTRGIVLSWWQYLVVLAWFAWVGMGAIFVVTSIGEYEPRAAGIAAILFGVTAIAGLVGMRWLYLRQTGAGGESMEAGEAAV